MAIPERLRVIKEQGVRKHLPVDVLPIFEGTFGKFQRARLLDTRDGWKYIGVEWGPEDKPTTMIRFMSDDKGNFNGSGDLMVNRYEINGDLSVFHVAHFNRYDTIKPFVVRNINMMEALSALTENSLAFKIDHVTQGEASFLTMTPYVNDNIEAGIKELPLEDYLRATFLQEASLTPENLGGRGKAYFGKKTDEQIQLIRLGDRSPWSEKEKSNHQFWHFSGTFVTRTYHHEGKRWRTHNGIDFSQDGSNKNKLANLLKQMLDPQSQEKDLWWLIKYIEKTYSPQTKFDTILFDLLKKIDVSFDSLITVKNKKYNNTQEWLFSPEKIVRLPPVSSPSI